MTGFSRIFHVAILFALVAGAHALSCASVVAQTSDERARVASWRPDAHDPPTLALDLAEALLNRGVPELADDELAALAPLPEQTAPSTRERYGVLALRAALERAELASREGRAAALERVDRIREIVEGPGANVERFDYFDDAPALHDAAKRYALAIAKAYYALGTLELDDASGNAAEPSAALSASLELTKRLARSLPSKDARPFLYWHARGALANLRDPNRCANAEKFAAALEKSSRAARDEYWFFTCVLLVETARESGDLELASRRLKTTLAELKKRSEDRDAPHEIAVALVAQELRLLQAEGKQTDALRQATLDVDLLNAPFPENNKRWNEIFYDAFDDLNLARVELYWRAIPTLPTQKELDRRESPDPDELSLAKETLVEEARRVARLVDSNVLRARSAMIARDAGETSGEWSTLELAAQESFRAERWRDALDAYDRAAQAANDDGDPDDAFRLRSTAAALVDKLLREKRLPQDADELAWREDAAKRFEALSRERPEAPNAAAFFLLALEYRESLGQDDAYARFEFLTLFPDAPNRAKFALDLARRSLDEDALDDARRALDSANFDEPLLDDALALERAIYAKETETSDAPREPALAATLARVLARASNAPPQEDDATLESLAKRLEDVQDWRLSRNDGAVYSAFFDLALADGACQNALFAKAAQDSLDAWRAASPEQDVATLARIDALRLSLALANGSEDAVVATLNGAQRGAVDLETLKRALTLAQTAEPVVRKRLAQFTLDALERAKDKSLRAELLRADALRLLDRAQESLNLFAQLRKDDPKNVDAALGIARLLTAQKDPKALEKALGFWSDVAELLHDSSKEWWDAKEETILIYCRLGQTEQADKIARTLWLTRDDPTDPDRRRRWERTIDAARRRPETDTRKKGAKRDS